MLHKLRNYEIYNLLYWIKSNSPESKIAADAYNDFCKTSPNFEPREYPDLDHWTSGVSRIEYRSHYSAEDLTNMDLDECIGILIEYKGNDWDYGRDGLLEELSRATTRSVTWFIGVASRLISMNEWKADIWAHIMKGWIESALDEAQWHEILGMISGNSEIHSIASELFVKSIEKDTIPPSIRPQVEQISDEIWASLQDLPEEEITVGGWLGNAINHSAGRITEFWIQALHKSHLANKANWSGLPAEYRARFNNALTSSSFSAQMARVVIASRFDYFHYLDAEWTIKNLMPLFDFNGDELTAEQAWHGLLYWGKIPTLLFNGFKPFLESAIDKIQDTEHNFRERLYAHIVDHILIAPSDPLGDGWFYRILSHPKTTDENRIFVARRILHRLRDEKNDFKESIWKRWLNRYWKDRLNNVPIPLSIEEADKFIEWVPNLQPIFPEAVEMACHMTQFSLYQTFLFTDIQERRLATDMPREVGRLLVHVLKKQPNDTLHCYELNPLYDVLSKYLDGAELEPLLVELKRLGCR